MARIAISLGNTLFNLTSRTPPTGGINATMLETFIKDVLPCYLESAKCLPFEAATPPGTQLPDRVLPLYVSVSRNDNLATTLTRLLLSLLTGTKYPSYNQTVCIEKELLWMANYDKTGICVKSTANYSFAISPAFVIDGKLISL